MPSSERGEQRLNVDPDCCLVFIDDTGHEGLAGSHAVYGLGGIVVMARQYEALLKPKWCELRMLITGDAGHPLHAAELPRPVPRPHLHAISAFLRQTFYRRFAITTARDVALPADLHPMQPALELLKRNIVKLAAYTPLNSMALIFESSTRANALLQRYFGELSIRENGRPTAVEHCLLPKRANEPGLEAADFIANIAGNMARWRLSGRSGFPRDFQAAFHGVPDSHYRYMHVSSVAATDEGDEVAGVELRELGEPPSGAGPRNP